MLTLENLQKIEEGSIFATGTFTDNELGLNIAGTGEELRWVAVKGYGYDDWCIYCHLATNDIEYIKERGDKVYRASNIKMCMPCDDEAFMRYRY